MRVRLCVRINQGKKVKICCQFTVCYPSDLYEIHPPESRLKAQRRYNQDELNVPGLIVRISGRWTGSSSPCGFLFCWRLSFLRRFQYTYYPPTAGALPVSNSDNSAIPGDDQSQVYPLSLFMLTHSRAKLPRSGVDAESQPAQYNQLYSGKKKNTHVNTSFPNVIDVYGRLFSWVLKWFTLCLMGLPVPMNLNSTHTIIHAIP